MKTLSFIKMHGLGNDFIVIDDLSAQKNTPLTPELAKTLCDRRFGIGADQILWLKPAKGVTARAPTDARMEIFNSDGSVAEMCGNGIRAVALYLKENAPKSHSSEYKIETLGGLIRVEVCENGNVRVNMGVPHLGAGFSGSEPESITAFGQKFQFYEVNIGNPHAIIFVQDVASFPAKRFGPEIEMNKRFPERTNVEFVEILKSEKSQAAQVRVWERGAGLTLACGTGACAAAIAVCWVQKKYEEILIHLPGGTLKMNWEGAGKPIMMEGPATEVFRGEYTVTTNNK